MEPLRIGTGHCVCEKLKVTDAYEGVLDALNGFVPKRRKKKWKFPWNEFNYRNEQIFYQFVGLTSDSDFLDANNGVYPFHITKLTMELSDCRK